MDQSFNEIKSQTTNTSERFIDVISTKMSKIRCKGKCYGCGSDHPKTSSDILPDMQSTIPLAKKVHLSGGGVGETRHKGAVKLHDKHCGRNHKDRKQHKHHGKKKFHEVTKRSDSDTGLSSSPSDSFDYEDENIGKLTFVIEPINVDTL